MRSTVIVAAYNEGDLLLRTLRSAVSAGNGLEYELLIADDGSTDGSVEAAVQEFPQVRVVRNEKRRGASGCKALGADHAKGDVLIFLDGHTNPEAGSLEALVQNIEDLDGKSIVTPRVATLDPNTWINDHGQSGYGYAINLDHMGCWWIGLKEMKKVKAAGRVMYESPALIGCAMGISKALYTKLHGFDRDMLTWGVEDLDFGLKCWLMGGRILHNPEIVIGHRFRKTFTNFKVPIEHLVANQMRMARKNYTESIWQAWIKMTRQRYEKNLWKRCREVYEEYQESAEQERSYLMGNRQYDELWYVQRFGGRWPRLEIRGRKKSKTQSKTLEALGSDAPPTPSASPSHGPSAGPSPSPKPKGVILLTGYWPPTNIVTPNGLLNDFAAAPNSFFTNASDPGPHGSYVQEDYKGYKLVAIASTFAGPPAPPDPPSQWGPGDTANPWQIDYQKTSTVFWDLIEKYKPIAVMSFSRMGAATSSGNWRLEIGSTNFANDGWDDTSLAISPPYIGKAPGDPASQDSLPNAPADATAPSNGPPDATEAAGFVRMVMAKGSQSTGTAALNSIMNAINNSGSGVTAFLNPSAMGQSGDPENFVSAFMGYHSMWYAQWAPARIGFHTHVSQDLYTSSSTPPTSAILAFEAQLDALIDLIKKGSI